MIAELCSITLKPLKDVFWQLAGSPVVGSVPAFVADDVPAPVRFTAVNWKPNFGNEEVEVFVPVTLIV